MRFNIILIYALLLISATNTESFEERLNSNLKKPIRSTDVIISQDSEILGRLTLQKPEIHVRQQNLQDLFDRVNLFLVKSILQDLIETQKRFESPLFIGR
jgi:hypothetical protein